MRSIAFADTSHIDLQAANTSVEAMLFRRPILSSDDEEALLHEADYSTSRFSMQLSASGLGRHRLIMPKPGR
jgi:hypothetical protein